MTNKTKQYKLLTISAIMLLTSAVYSNAQIESARTNAAQFEINMDVQELINGQSQEMDLPQPEPQMVTNADLSGGVYGPGKSAFGGLDECNIVNARFVKQPSLKDAVKMLGPCMKAVSKRYGVMVSASEYLIGYPIPPNTEPIPSRVHGIGILVSGKLPVGNTVLIDLHYTVDTLHDGSLLCHPAKVEYLGEIVPLDKSMTQHPSDSAIKQAIKDEIESEFLGVNAYSVVSGINLGQIGPMDSLCTFKAHKKIVGHGWEERYSITGTYDFFMGQVAYQSNKIWGNRPIHYPIRHPHN